MNCLLCGRSANEMTLFQLSTRVLSLRVCEVCKDRWVGYGLATTVAESGERAEPRARFGTPPGSSTAAASLEQRAQLRDAG